MSAELPLTPRFTSVWQSLGRSVRALTPGGGLASSEEREGPSSSQVIKTRESGREWAERQLAALISHHGFDLVCATGRCEKLIRTRCGSYRAEAELLCMALRAEVPGCLFQLQVEDVQRASILQKLSAQFVDRGVSRTDAEWAVRAWAQALGITISDFRPSTGSEFHDTAGAIGDRGPTRTVRVPREHECT